MAQPCIHENTIGKVQEFIESFKGYRATLISLVFAIVIQIITFGFLWGSLTTTVSQDTKQIWDKLTPTAYENRRDIDKILAKFDLITTIQGIQGVQGERGNVGATGANGKTIYR